MEAQEQGGLHPVPGQAVSTDTSPPPSFTSPILSLRSLQFYLPPEGLINKDFLKQVLADEKALIKKSDISYIEVPHYEELSVKALWPQFAEDDLMVRYFPDEYPQGKGPPREYFFNILHTLYPEFLQRLLTHAHDQRMTAEGERGQRESI